MVTVADVYLSEISKKDVLDQYGMAVGTLWDLKIVPGTTYPKVTHLILKANKKYIAIPVSQIHLFNKYVITLNLSGRQPQYYEYKPGDILAKRHILDKQILDVNGAKIVRVNDLKLGEGDGTICLMGIDVGYNGILRRIDGGNFINKALAAMKRPIKENIIGWHFLQTIDPELVNLTLNVAKEQLGKMHPSDLAEVLTEIPPEEGRILLSSVDEELAGEALHEVAPEIREKLLKEMDKEMISDILEEMPPDEAADLLGDMPEEKSKELLSLMEKDEAKEVQDLLLHEEDTAGGLMTSEFLDFLPDTTVGEALTNIRLLAPDVEFIYYIYVVDDEDHLLGVLSLKKLLTSQNHMKLSEIMTGSVKSVYQDTERKEIAEVISKYDFVAIPVLDEQERVTGIITVDDVVDLLVPNPIRKRRRTVFQ